MKKSCFWRQANKEKKENSTLILSIGIDETVWKIPTPEKNVTSVVGETNIPFITFITTHARWRKTNSKSIRAANIDTTQKPSAHVFHCASPRVCREERFARIDVD